MMCIKIDQSIQPQQENPHYCGILVAGPSFFLCADLYSLAAVPYLVGIMIALASPAALDVLRVVL